MTRQEIYELVAYDIRYLDGWYIWAGYDGKTYIQVIIKLPGQPIQVCRKWYFDDGMSKSEVVQTAFMAIMAAQEHETREAFKYDGRAIFGPHFNVDELWCITNG